MFRPNLPPKRCVSACKLSPSVGGLKADRFGGAHNGESHYAVDTANAATGRMLPSPGDSGENTGQ